MREVNPKYKITEEDREKAKEFIGTPMKYSKIAKIFGQEPMRGSGSRRAQLDEWERNFKIEHTENPSRYTIMEIYDEPKRYCCRLKNDNKQKIEQFCKDRHLTLLSEIPDDIRTTEEFSYVCDFHPNETQTTTWRDLYGRIGCPLCTYPMSRFEVMMFLGLPNAVHRSKIDGEEFDIYLPNLKTVVEFNGHFYHEILKPKDKRELKQEIANRYGLNFIVINECVDYDEMGIQDKVITVLPYGVATIEQKEEIISLIQSVLPYEHKPDAWNEAAKYMRDWKAKHITKKEEKPWNRINQYDSQGNLLNSFGSFKDINNLISSGYAFGYEWRFEEE